MRRTTWLILTLLFLLVSGTLAQFGGSSGGGNGTTTQFSITAFANLATPPSSGVRYCSNCAATNPCTSGGGGAFAFRVGGAWDCQGTGASAGTVTSFSAGTLSPLFTTSVANPTTTPALSFSLTNAAAHTFFANDTGSTGAPSFTSFVAGTNYEVPLTFSTGLTRTTNTVTVNVSQNITTLSNLTTNGLVTTSGGVGTLGVTAPGTGILTWLSTPSSANLRAALTDELGTGAALFDGATPTSFVLTNATGLPVGSITGLGTGVGTALAINVGTAGSFVTNGGALGSPSSAGTIPAFTLGGTIAGGGQQLNNIIIGTTTPLAGSFTTLIASTSTKTPIIFPASDSTTAIKFTQADGVTVVGVFDTVNKFFGVAGTPTVPLEVSGLTVATEGVNANVILHDTTATAQNVGAGIVFQGTYSGGQVSFGAIKANKESATTTNYAGSLGLYTRADGGNEVKQISIGSTGTITLNTGVTNAAGTPGSLCYNTATFEMTKNNALTCTVSSQDYKFDITDLGQTPFDKLRPVEFFYRDQPDRPRWGFISEEVAKADRRFADGYDDKGIPRSLDQNAILAATVLELQRLKIRVAELETNSEKGR